MKLTQPNETDWFGLSLIIIKKNIRKEIFHVKIIE